MARESRGAEGEPIGRLFVRHLPLMRARVRGRWSLNPIVTHVRACTDPIRGVYTMLFFPLLALSNPEFLSDRSNAKISLEFTVMNLNEVCEPCDETFVPLTAAQLLIHLTFNKQHVNTYFAER